MRNRLVLIGIAVMACTFFLSARQSTTAANHRPVLRSSAFVAGQEVKASTNQCLGCHGPFAQLIEKSANYVALSGEKISPHRYVPHDSKRDEDIPECSQCHSAHPLDPLPTHGSVDLSKVTVQSCYDTCHHEKNFTSCKSCHA